LKSPYTGGCVSGVFGFAALAPRRENDVGAGLPSADLEGKALSVRPRRPSSPLCPAPAARAGRHCRPTVCIGRPFLILRKGDDKKGRFSFYSCRGESKRSRRRRRAPQAAGRANSAGEITLGRWSPQFRFMDRRPISLTHAQGLSLARSPLQRAETSLQKMRWKRERAKPLMSSPPSTTSLFCHRV